jgi:hypothetical protein
MTEAEWLTATNPTMLCRLLCDQRGQSRSPIGRRKLRLYACACCRRAWHLLDDERSREAVELAERYADGVAPRAELDRMWNGGRSGFLCHGVCEQIGPAVIHAPDTAAFILGLAADGAMKEGFRNAEAVERIAQVALLHDIFGNPFRPVTFSPEWRTDTAVSLARTMYASRDFGAMPILADALQDAGCDNDDILSHCRGAGPHVRGCWVVDLVLGKQ